MTRKPNKGKKSSISQAKWTPGRHKGGMERESRRKMKGYELTILVQGCRFTATKHREHCHAYFYSQLKQIAAMFQSLTSSFCSSARGPRFWLLYYFYFNYSWIPSPGEGVFLHGKIPTCWTNIHTLHSPKRSLRPLVFIPAPLEGCGGNEGGFEQLSAHLIMLSSTGEFPFFGGDAGAKFTGKNEG